jgi:hypothetical protein
MALTPDRKSQLITAATAYFEGLARRDFASVPWADAIVFRGPLTPGGADAPLMGRDAVLAFFSALGPNLGEVRIVGHFLNEDLTAIVTKAEVGISSRLACCAWRTCSRSTPKDASPRKKTTMIRGLPSGRRCYNLRSPLTVK